MKKIKKRQVKQSMSSGEKLSDRLKKLFIGFCLKRAIEELGPYFSQIWNQIEGFFDCCITSFL